MEITQELFEKIEAYIAGSLSAEELERFETRVQKDPELQKEVEIHRDLQNELSRKKTLDFRKKLVSIGKEIEEENSNVSKINWFRYWKVAASILLVIGLSTFLWFPYTSSSDAIFSEFYTPYPISYTKRGVTEYTDEIYRQSILDYKQKEYHQVIPNLKKILQTDPDNETIKLCLGNAYLNDSQLEQARTLFNAFLPSSNVYDDAQWFLAFTYLKMNQKEQMIPILKKLIAEDTKYKDDAMLLLEKLK